MRSQTSSGEMPSAEMTSAIVSMPPNRSESSSRKYGTFPNTRARAISIWPIPVASSMAPSSAWE